MNRTALAAPALALSLLASSPALARNDNQLWTTLNVTVKASDRIRLQNELNVRFSENRDGLYEVENITQIGYAFDSHITAWAGYVHDPQYAGGDFTVMERRAREQVTFDNIAKLGKASLSARLRLEQRWRDHIDGTGWRLRPYVKAAVPLGGKTAPTLNLGLEPFINLNNTSYQAVDGLERTRTAASLSFPVAKTVKLELGYLNQHRFNRHAPDDDDHALTISVGANF